MLQFTFRIDSALKALLAHTRRARSLSRLGYEHCSYDVTPEPGLILIYDQGCMLRSNAIPEPKGFNGERTLRVYADGFGPNVLAEDQNITEVFPLHTLGWLNGQYVRFTLDDNDKWVVDLIQFPPKPKKVRPAKIITMPKKPKARPVKRKAVKKPIKSKKPVKKPAKRVAKKRPAKRGSKITWVTVRK